MAQDSKGKFFSGFRKSEPPVSAPAQKTPPAPAPQREAALVSAPQPKPAPAPKPAAVTTAEPVIDTVAAFNLYCTSLVDILNSQLKVVEQIMTMLTSSINKAADGLKAK